VALHECLYTKCIKIALFTKCRSLYLLDSLQLSETRFRQIVFVIAAAIGAASVACSFLRFILVAAETKISMTLFSCFVCLIFESADKSITLLMTTLQRRSKCLLLTNNIALNDVQMKICVFWRRRDNKFTSTFRGRVFFKNSNKSYVEYLYIYIYINVKKTFRRYGAIRFEIKINTYFRKKSEFERNNFSSRSRVRISFSIHFPKCSFANISPPPNRQIVFANVNVSLRVNKLTVVCRHVRSFSALYLRIIRTNRS